jgi:hypothetical protein
MFLATDLNLAICSDIWITCFQQFLQLIIWSYERKVQNFAKINKIFHCISFDRKKKFDSHFTQLKNLWVSCLNE